jgi:ADP-ribose pyrophosphatase YjhB (NUDIX family)
MEGVEFEIANKRLRETTGHDLDDLEYSEMLYGVVPSYISVIVFCEGKILLGERASEPNRGILTCPDDRRRRAESFEQSARRCLQENLGLFIAEDRVHYIRTDSCAFSRRAQEPQDAPCHIDRISMLVEITRAEKYQITCRGASFSKYCWEDIDRIIECGLSDLAVEAAIQNVWTELYSPLSPKIANGLHFVDGKAGGVEFEAVIQKLATNRKFLPLDLYTRILDTTVVSCVDIAVRCGNELLLGRRVNEPYKGGKNYAGGKRNIGESFEETGIRHLRRDWGLDIAPERLSFVRTDSWGWTRREQPPKDHGCHMEGTTMVVEITPEEKNTIKYGGDFDEYYWMNIEEIITDPTIHPVPRAAARNIYVDLMLL